MNIEGTRVRLKRHVKLDVLTEVELPPIPHRPLDRV